MFIDSANALLLTAVSHNDRDSDKSCPTVVLACPNFYEYIVFCPHNKLYAPSQYIGLFTCEGGT